MRVARRWRKARSCVTNTMAPGYSARNASSQAIASTSRWLVGSSSSKRSGPATRVRASRTRRRQPQVGRHDLDAVLQPPPVSLFELVLQTAELREHRFRTRVGNLHGHTVVG